MGKGIACFVVLIIGALLGIWLSGNCQSWMLSYLMADDEVLSKYEILKDKYGQILLDNKDLKREVKALAHERDVLAKGNSELQEASHLRWNNFRSMYE